MPAVPLNIAQIRAGLHSIYSLDEADQFTFSIPDADSFWETSSGNYTGSEQQPFTNYSVLSAAQAANFRLALAEWDELIAPNFIEVADTPVSHGEVRIAFTSDQMDPGTAGYAFQGTNQTPTSIVGDIWLNSNSTAASFAVGTNDFSTLVHEIGHVLGLKHPFEPTVIPDPYETTRYTVMSYTDAGRHVTFGGGGSSITSSSVAVATVTPMVLDIAAVQDLYGADPFTRGGDTVYTFNQNDAFLQSIYDAGGTDTFDLSSITRTNIVDLAFGAYSSIAYFPVEDQAAYWKQFYNPGLHGFIDSQLAGDDTYTWSDNVGIAFSTVIENVIGGSGNDTITGNIVANTLQGGGGLDLLIGGGGLDLLIGGVGADELVGGADADVFRYASASESMAGAEDWLSDFAHGADMIDLQQIAVAYVSYEVAVGNGSTMVTVGTQAGPSLTLRVAGVATEADFLFAPKTAFAAPAQWSLQVPSTGQRWHVGDFNGDGMDDVFRYLPGISGADMFLSDGTSFDAAGSWTGAGNGSAGWHIGDFNGDGMDDIFRYVPGTSGAHMFLSDGTSFDAAGSWTGAGNGSAGWHIGDFNGDGMDDIFRYVPGTSGADMFLSDGTSFDAAGSWTGAGNGSAGWRIGDFNGDGMDDIFRYVPGASGADMFLSTGSGFAHAGSWTGAGHGQVGWQVGDFNGDGMDDVFRYLPGMSGADVFLSSGTGFVRSGSWTTAWYGQVGWHIGDFTGDGTSDLMRVLASGTEVLI